MKNPMDRQLEKRLSERAVAIGREGEVAAFKELLELLGSSSANARRLAASALGKLAWMGVDQAATVAALAPMARRDPHPQTRQYVIKALKAYGAAAQGCLHDLRDMANNPAEKDYIQRDAAGAVTIIEAAVQVALAAAERLARPGSVASNQIKSFRLSPSALTCGAKSAITPVFELSGFSQAQGIWVGASFPFSTS